ncbi:hypothetical protein ACIO87_38330 [Streptomyces sp. NPDC087218]|uniref:hypothetical protein n=1 Tax=Streptomyces sp. NPDC087218 TaxID=3365769 RepID=UPI0037F967F6
MGTSRDNAVPKKGMAWQLKAVLWCLLVVWLGWLVCSMAALNASSTRSPAGSSGGMIAIDVLIMAITGDSTASWALTGSRVFGLAMVLMALGLLIRYVSNRQEGKG